MPRALLLRLADELPEDLRALHATCRGASPVVSARAAEVLAAMAAARASAEPATPTSQDKGEDTGKFNPFAEGAKRPSRTPFAGSGMG